MDAEIEKLLDQMESMLTRIRSKLGSTPNGSTSDMPDEERWYWLLLAVEREGGRVLRSRWSDLGRAHGYDPRGLGGFFVGKGAMESEGDWRGLSDAGRRFVEDSRSRYGANSPFEY